MSILALLPGTNPLVDLDDKGYNVNWDRSVAPLAESLSKEIKTGEKILNDLQFTLDVIGLIPGAGELADGANALISLLRGNYVDAALSAGSMIPFAGWGSTAAKFIKKAAKAADTLGTAAKDADVAFNTAEAIVKNADELADAGESAYKGLEDQITGNWHNPDAPDLDGGAPKGAGETKYYRVQTPGESGSMERVIVNDDGTIKITTPNSSLNLSYNTPEHAQYFKALKGSDSYIVEFEVDDWFHDFIQENAIPQRYYRSNPLNQGMTAPKIVDVTTPGSSMEFPPIWNKWFEEYAKNGRIF